MASLGVGFTLPAAKPTSSSLSSKVGGRGRQASVVTVGATRGTSATAKEEKGFLEWLWGAMQKDEQLLETDPILQKVEDKTPKPKPSVSAPAPKTNGGFGGFGGLFAKK